MVQARLDKLENNMEGYDIMDFHYRYQHQYNETILWDYIWSLVRKTRKKKELEDEATCLTVSLLTGINIVSLTIF